MGDLTAVAPARAVRDRAIELARRSESRSVDMLSTLVRIPSRTGEEGEAQGYLAHHLRRAGAATRLAEPDIAALFARYPQVAQYPTHWRHDLILPYDHLPSLDELERSGLGDILNYRGRPNLTGRWAGSGGGRSLILNGHIDTVTIEPRHLWHADPFGAEVAGGRLYGRGSADMKGGLGAALMAMSYLAEAGFVPAGDITFQSVVNEEHAGNGTLDLVRLGAAADLAIVLEPTENRIATGHPAGVYFQLDVFGVPRPPGARWEEGRQIGISAIELLPSFVSGLLDLEREINRAARERSAPFSLVLGKVSGGSYETLTAAEASLRGLAYFAAELGTPADVMARLREAVVRIEAGRPHSAVRPAKLSFLHHDDGVVDGGARAGEALLGHVLACRGLPPGPLRAPYCCDLRHLVNRGGMPGLIFGPGSIAEAHRPNESIGLREYLTSIEILIDFICAWCGGTAAETQREEDQRACLPSI